MLKSSWSLIQGLLDPETATKISMIRKGDMNELLKKIPVEQIESRYNGQLPNPSVYWPPFTTIKPNVLESSKLILDLTEIVERREEMINEQMKKMNESSDTRSGSNSSETEKDNPITLSKRQGEDDDEDNLIFSEDENGIYVSQINLYSSAFTVKRYLKDMSEPKEINSKELIDLPPPVENQIIFEDKSIKMPFCGFCRNNTRSDQRSGNNKSKNECNIF